MLIERDQNGVPSAIVSPDGLTTFLTIDGENHLTRITYPDGSYYNFQYTADGLLTAKVDPNGNRFENIFDSMGRLSTISDEEGGRWQYSRTYETDGDIVVESLTAEGNLTIFREHTDSTGAYSSTVTDSTGAETSYSRSADGLAVQESLSCGMSLRTNGTEVTTYNYSSRGELLRVTLPDGRLIEYNHDPIEKRIAMKVNGVTFEKYLWSGLTRLLAVFDGSGTLKMRFEYADGRMPVAVSMAGVMYYLAYDQVGSLRLVVDGAGNIVKEVQYDSFGNVILDSNAGFEIPFGFAGGFHDKGS